MFFEGSSACGRPVVEHTCAQQDILIHFDTKTNIYTYTLANALIESKRK